MKLRRTSMGLLAAVFLLFAAASAHAEAAVCKANRNGDVMHTAKDGSDCEAIVSGGGKSMATAKRGGSADATVDSGGKATAFATREGTADATADSHGVATANAVRQGTAKATADGKAGKCTALANGISSGTAMAQCEAGGFAQATATNGGSAEAFDDLPPTCSPGPSGTATVISSGGNC